MVVKLQDLKIAVYTICKNEEQFIKRWLDSCKDANYILVTDTGSTDNTLNELISKSKMYPNFHFNEVRIDPWRFDDARQFSLMSLPNDIDICICLDMDEVLVEGWKDILVKEWKQSIDRLRYNYVWSWDEEGNPALTYYADKIHSRHGFRWVNPVHEVLVKDGRLDTEKQHFIDDTLIEHYPDNTKSRSSYLELLSLAVKESPLNDRNAHYFARDLMFAGMYTDAIIEFKRHLDLPTATWKEERAASYRFMGDCYWALGLTEKAMDCFFSAIGEAPNEREGYVAIAQAYRALENWEGVIDMCKQALAITDRPNTYICQPNAWSNWPDQMLEEAMSKLKEK